MARYHVQLSGNMGSEVSSNSWEYACRKAREMSLSTSKPCTVWDDADEKHVVYVKGKRNEN